MLTVLKCNITHCHVTEQTNSDMQTLTIKTHLFLTTSCWIVYVNYKMVPQKKVKNDPADTYVKWDLSFDTTFDSWNISWETTFKGMQMTHNQLYWKISVESCVCISCILTWVLQRLAFGPFLYRLNFKCTRRYRLDSFPGHLTHATQKGIIIRFISHLKEPNGMFSVDPTGPRRKQSCPLVVF